MIAMPRILFTALFALALPSCTPFTETDPDAAPTHGASKGDTPIPSSGTFAIDLPTTLELAAGRNLDLAAAIENANRAAARSDRAALSLVPDLAVGASFAKQNGLLQETSGDPVETKRVADSAGLGVGSVGSGLGTVPGLSLEIPLGRAVFEPLAARQDRRAALAAVEARRHEVLADAAAGYYELVRARSALVLARDVEAAAGKLARSTRQFAEAGEGLEADAERALATHLLRKGQTARAEADLVRSSSKLARVLHLPPSLTLVPTDKSVAPTDLVDLSEPSARMIATALRFRPETAQYQAEVAAAATRLQERKIRPFLPNVAATYSNYDFGAGTGSSTDRDDNREEVAALVYWRLEGLGFGDAAEAREKEAELNLARLKEAKMLDRIADEVAASRAEAIAQSARLDTSARASVHARKAYELTTQRLEQLQGLPIEALSSIQTMAEARQAEVDAILDYNVAQHRLLAAMGHPRTK